MRRIQSLLLATSLSLLAWAPARAGEPLEEGRLLDLGFVESPADGVRFAGRFGGVRAWIHDDGFVLEGLSTDAEGRAAVRVSVEDVPQGVRPRGEVRRPARVNLLRGRDPSTWRRSLATYGAVVWSGVRPGVDLLLHERDGALAYDIVLAAGAAAANGDVPVFRVEGHRSLRLDASGSLLLDTPAGPFRMAAPVSFALTADGTGRPLASSFRLLDERRFTIEVEAPRPGEDVLVDPGVTFATFLGGSSFDRIDAVTRDADGTLVVAGQTLSFDFPATPGAFDTTLGGSQVGSDDAFVARLSADGSTVLWATFLGGTDGAAFLGEFACDVTVDPSTGDVIVAGTTSASDFPTTAGALDASLGGTYDAFVARLSADGSQLVASTYLGGKKTENAAALALDQQGRVFVTGDTSSPDFPVSANAFDASLDGPGVFDGYLAVLDGSLSTLAYATYFGGSDDDFGVDVAVSPQGRALVTGESDSLDFPVVATGAFGSQSAGGSEAVAMEIDVDQGSASFALYLGGSTTDAGRAVFGDAQGRVYVVGKATSSDLPTTPGADATLDGDSDAFLLVLSPGGTGLVFGSYLGGSGVGGFGEEATGVAVDQMGRVVVVGRTNSADFPTAGENPDTTLDGIGDAFVARFAADFSGLDSATLLGGMGDDSATDVLVVEDNDVVVVGATSSVDFPITAGAAQESHGGGFTDGFVAEITTDCAGGFEEFGTGCPDGGGQVPHLAGTGCPEVGATLGVTLTGGPPGALALLIAGVTKGQGQVTQACTIDVFPFLVALPLLLDGQGGFQATYSVPPGFPPGVVHIQTLHADPSAPTGLSASNALSIGFLVKP